jgi:hypothetical protein
MNVANINSYVMTLSPKVGVISFNEKVISEFLMNHVVFDESRSFSQKNSDSYVVTTWPP